MIRKEVLTLNDTEVIVRELTVADIRNWLASLIASSEYDPVNSELFEDFTLDDIQLVSNVSSQFVESLTLDQLRQIFDLAKALNPDFFSLRQRMADRGKRILSKS